MSQLSAYIKTHGIGLYSLGCFIVISVALDFLCQCQRRQFSAEKLCEFHVAFFVKFCGLPRQITTVNFAVDSCMKENRLCYSKFPVHRY